MEKTLIIDKLITNVLLRRPNASDHSLNALKIFSHKNPYLIIEYIDNSIQNVQQIAQDVLNLYCILFLEATKQLKQSENENNDPKKNEMNLKVFVSLQFYFSKLKNTESFNSWEELCQEFISSEDISKKLFPLVLNLSSLFSACSFITLFYCSNFVTDGILTTLDSIIIKKPAFADKISTLINVNPSYFIRLLSKLSEKRKEKEKNSDEKFEFSVSPFLSFQFRYLLPYFLDHPNDDNLIKCIEDLFGLIYPQACPAHLRYYVTRICNDLAVSTNENNSTSLNPSTVVLVENMLIQFCSIPDVEIWKKTVDFILKQMHYSYQVDMQKHNQATVNNAFPIDAIEMTPGCSSSSIFSASLENINKLCFSFNYGEFELMNPLDIVLSSLLAAIDTQKAAISFKTLSSLLISTNEPTSQIKFSQEQMIMIISSITAVTSRKLLEPSLCRLAINVMKLSSEFISESDVTLLTKYIINSSILMNNSHYLLQLVSVNNEFHQIIFDLIAESLFDEDKIALIPSFLQTINLFLLVLSKNSENDDEEIQNSFDSSEETFQHPLVPILLKKSIAEKSLFLLRMLSCLMSLGAMHSFVPAMISILSVFFDFAFPLASDEIKSNLEAVTKRINSLQPQLQLHLSLINNSNAKSSYNNNSNRVSEFGSIIMSLLSNIIKLINDSQFRLSLCSAVVHDVEMNSYSLHNQNCLWIFDTIIPFLPVDVSSANIEKLFKVVQFYPSSTSNNSSQGNQNVQPPSEAQINQTLSAFADVLGSISRNNCKLVIPFIKKWKDMKSNYNFLVGKKPQPIPYSFIAMTLASISRDIEVPVLLEIANTHLFPLLIQLTKRKNTELNPAYCINALIELCKRLTFHKVPQNFTLSNSEVIFKYIVNIFLQHKQKSMYKMCLAAFRYFIQVPPCLTAEQRTIIKEKVIIPSFIMFTINEINNNEGDKQLFLELRGLLFAMICTLPEVNTIIVLLVSLMPNCHNNEVLSLIWRLLSLFDSRREKASESSSNADNNSGNNSPIPDEKANSYNLIKFYKPVQIDKIINLPQIIADLLCAAYNRRKNIENSPDLALQSIYLLFRIDRNITNESVGDGENLPLENISNISDLSKTVLNKLTQNEINNILNYSIDKMKKIKSASANYSFAISQIMKFVFLQAKLAVIDSHKDQLCNDAITFLNTENSSNVSKMQSLIAEFISSPLNNILESYDFNGYKVIETNEVLFSFPSPDFVQQLLLKYPEIFVRKLVQVGFNESTRKIVLKAFEEETGLCTEILLQQLCLFLLEMPEDDKNLISSSTLLFIAFIIINCKNSANNDSQLKFNFKIPTIHIYQAVCSLLIFGFSMNLFLNAKDIYTTILHNKSSTVLSTAASLPIMIDKMQKQQQLRHLFIKILSLCLMQVPQKSSTTDENKSEETLNEETTDENFYIIPLDASKAFKYSISVLIKGPENLLLIDVMNFLMSACQLSKSKVSSGIAALCGEVLCYYDDLLIQNDSNEINENDEKQRPTSILNLFFPTLLSLIFNFDEFTCIVSLSEMTKFMKRTDLIQCEEGKKEFPIYYISRILQAILKRCSSSTSSKSSPMLLTNDVFISAIACIEQFCKSFSSRLNEEMHSVLFNIFVELLKSCGNRFSAQISSILAELVNSLSKNDDKIPEQLIKYVVMYDIISFEKNERLKKPEQLINCDQEKADDNQNINFKVDVKNDENVVVFVFDTFLDSKVPLLISSALNLLKEEPFNSLISHFIEKIVAFIGNQDDNVAASATSIVEVSSSFFV